MDKLRALLPLLFPLAMLLFHAATSEPKKRKRR